VDTDAKKRELFKKALNVQLCVHPTLFCSGNFNELISASIEQEDASHGHMGEEEEAHVRTYQRCPSEVPHGLYTSS
jgi:hypothetical protein